MERDGQVMRGSKAVLGRLDPVGDGGGGAQRVGKAGLHDGSDLGTV